MSIASKEIRVLAVVQTINHTLPVEIVEFPQWSGKKIKYTKGDYKYVLDQDYVVETGICPLIEDICSPFAHMDQSGLLWIVKGYAWNGPSGPTIDTKTFLRGSLIHDALYQLMRWDLLDNNFREAADDLLRDICLEDGMNPIRAWYVHKAVRLAGKELSTPSTRRKIRTAP